MLTVESPQDPPELYDVSYSFPYPPGRDAPDGEPGTAAEGIDATTEQEEVTDIALGDRRMATPRDRDRPRWITTHSSGTRSDLI